MDGQVTLYRVTNGSATAGFETEGAEDGFQYVTKTAPILRRLILGRKLIDVMPDLISRGWNVEIVR